MKIDYTYLLTKGIKTIGGFQKGFYNRKHYKLDKIDLTDDIVNVIIPREMYSMLSSYFFAMFGNSIRTLGREKFNKKYIFDCSDCIKKEIDENITYALNCDIKPVEFD